MAYRYRTYIVISGSLSHMGGFFTPNQLRSKLLMGPVELNIFLNARPNMTIEMIDGKKKITLYKPESGTFLNKK